MMIEFVVLPVYIIIFVLAVCGNILFLVSVSRNPKLHSAVFIFLANQSFSDLITTILSVFIGVEFLMKSWIFTEPFCKINNAIMEAGLTVSVLSLTAVAIERYMSICQTKQLRKTVTWTLKVCGCIWIISILVCSPLFYAYRLTDQLEITTTILFENKTIVNITEIEITYGCSTNNWSDTSGIIYFSVHGTLVYLLPLSAMIYSHTKIARVVRQTTLPTSTTSGNLSKASKSYRKTSQEDADSKRYSAEVLNVIKEKAQKDISRKRKIINLLMVITITFFLLYTPFIVGRIIAKTNVELDKLTWALIQLVLFITTTTNFFITLRMSPEFKKTVKSLFRCIGRPSSRSGVAVITNNITASRMQHQISSGEHSAVI